MSKFWMDDNKKNYPFVVIPRAPVYRVGPYKEKVPRGKFKWAILVLPKAEFGGEEYLKYNKNNPRK